MKIVYYRKEDGQEIDGTDYLFVMNDQVFMDNGLEVESSPRTVSFDYFIHPRPDLDWKVQLT